MTAREYVWNHSEKSVNIMNHGVIAEKDMWLIME